MERTQRVRVWEMEVRNGSPRWGSLLTVTKGRKGVTLETVEEGGSTLALGKLLLSVRKVSREISSVSQAQESVTGDCQYIFDHFFFAYKLRHF